MATVLNVYLNTVLVGQITPLPGDRSIFTFAESYEQNPERPTLSLGFLGLDRQLAYTPQPTQKRLHPFFSNLLPEGKLRQYVAKEAGVHPDREFFLLSLAGNDLPGAVIIRPEGEPPEPEAIAPGPMEAESNSDAPIKFSLAGVQMKFSAIQETNGGLTIPATGRGGSWIVKLASETFEAVPENEAAMMSVAKAAGLDVPAFGVVSIDNIAGLPEGMRQDRRAYIVKRFDRAGSDRIHIEDMAQIFRQYPTEKYGKLSYRNIAEVVWRETGETGLREFIGRLVFNAAIGNGDMHAKNWSLIYRDGRNAALSPAYDFLTTLPYVRGTETLALSLVGTKRFADIDEARFIRLAEQANLPPEIVRSAARDTARRTAAAWSELRHQLALPKPFIEAVDRHMETVPIIAAG